jgi:hypothetical protein
VDRVVDFAWTSRTAMANCCEPGDASHTSPHLILLGGVKSHYPPVTLEQ